MLTAPQSKVRSPENFVLPPNMPAAQTGAKERMDSVSESIKTGRLTTGKPWAIVKSKANALPQKMGEHYVLHAPRDENVPGGDGLARHELTELEKMELWFEADRQAIALSKKLANPDYYRVECNGLAAAHRTPLHIHIIIGKKGVEFRRSTDRVDLSLGSLGNFLKNYLSRWILRGLPAKKSNPGSQRSPKCYHP